MDYNLFGTLEFYAALNFPISWDVPSGAVSIRAGEIFTSATVLRNSKDTETNAKADCSSLLFAQLA